MSLSQYAVLHAVNSYVNTPYTCVFPGRMHCITLVCRRHMLFLAVAMYADNSMHAEKVGNTDWQIPEGTIERAKLAHFKSATSSLTSLIWVA